MFSYIPHTEQEERAMLDAIGIGSLDELFDDVRQAGCLLDRPLDIDKGRSEEQVLDVLRNLAGLNVRGISFLGAGSYDHAIPSAVRMLASLPSFVTAYTPYQPEISQGVLQAIFEYQSMICELTGMDVSNASLYDGASAAAEAAALAIAEKRKSNKVILSATMHPFAIDCVKTWALGTGREVVILPEKDGVSDFSMLGYMLDEGTAAFIAQSPNRYGYLEDFTGVADKVHQNKSLFVISSDPLSLAMQKSQAEWGADVAIGDTQVLGIPMGFGGPYCGYMAVTKPLMRKIPGRIVGQTVDTEGRRVYVLTLQAREQHIKRERATSNICSNEALCCLVSVIHTSLLGWAGLKEASNQSYCKAHYLCDGLRKLGYEAAPGFAPFWCEFPVLFESDADLERFVSKMKAEGIFSGVRLSRLTRNDKDALTLLVAVTERRTREQLDRYLEISKEAR
ncbi:MAG: aminomethyl-transferring glycine dehydrogenase subunit GcvPA [Spirochaetales bacterium]|jgi:glycine dehydrogenase subunit 1|nr:aminomethyl-transferring glycine dehydrogenase subunit GcvPA [Spirochaetales bacterium]